MLRSLFGKSSPDEKMALAPTKYVFTPAPEDMTVAQLIEGMEGWCTPYKAQRLADLASAPGCKLAVEIGIFGGKSLLPVAYAFKKKGVGVIYGIEPWEADVAVETATGPGNDDWWKSLDFNAIKRGFFTKAMDCDLMRQIRVLECPSDVGMRVFESQRFAGKIDLVHVDGAHSYQASVGDSVRWFDLLSPGGHIVLDDVNWPTVRLASDYLTAVAELVETSSGDDNGYFQIFRKPAGASR